ncbi:MAG: tRNA 2-thiouridine(34) synthase MnmA [Anaerolineae bacterium]|jgi:tRNA-specific 2-thiouridylase|nr:MAG: tRNA 2-thiouridine(34) synthase MnmA [Anaerolineae bacterium]
MNGKTVVVGMSGGVDSSVAAALLKRQGYQVIGVMLNLWSEVGKESSNRCCTPDAMRLAKKVAAKLDIPFYTLDVRERFYQQIVSYFVEGYQQGITPNPCIQCNRHIRWGALFEFALSLGADYFSTGHYARISQDEQGIYHLLRAKDTNKDQSYVLHVLTQADLSRTLFPLAELTKPEVRQLASEFQLPVANRVESQDLCFLSGEDYRTFLLRHMEKTAQPGAIIDTQGRLLGQHRGLAFYTIGQRKGLGINVGQPMYVIKKDVTNNTLIVGSREETRQSHFTVARINWIRGIPTEKEFDCTVKVRYLSPFLNARVKLFEDNSCHVVLAQSYWDITPGQAAVFYQGDECLGGGMIQTVLT